MIPKFIITEKVTARRVAMYILGIFGLCFLLSIVWTLLLFTPPVQAKHEKLEKEYQAKWCNEHNGKQEVAYGNVRVDCETPDMAVEFDFAYNWAQCVGQSLRYGQKTKKQPACALILERAGDEQYAENIKWINGYYGCDNKQIEIIFIKGY